MAKKISVIIPVYNGKEHLNKCVDSVLQQDNFSVEHIEILLINDGSRDDSAKIIDRYASMYPSVIKAIHQENQGVARTRNKGIRLAMGEYTMFIDQDDWIDSGYCAHFYEAAVNSGADVVCGGYRRPDAAGKVREHILPPQTRYGKYMVMAAWAKLHRTAFLKQNQVEFFQNKIGEDSVFTIKEIACKATWEMINYVGYNWFYNEASVSNTSQRRLSTESVTALMRLLRRLHTEGAPLVSTNEFNYFLLRTISFYLLFAGRYSTKNEYMRAYKELFGWFDAHRNQKTSWWYDVVGPKSERVMVKGAITAVTLLHRTKLMGVFANMYCKGSPLR